MDFWVKVTFKLKINHLIRFSTSELVENDSSFMILLHIVPKLSFAVYKKMTVCGYLGFLALAHSADIFERDIGAKSFSYNPSYMDQQ